MSRIHANNFSTTLNGAISNSATSIEITSATGFPTVGAGVTANLTIEEGSNVEIVTVSARSGTTLTVTRGVEGTSGTAFSSGALIELRPTADSVDRKTDGAASATDNAIARFDGTTGKIIQNSAITVADTTGNMAGVGTLNTHTIPGGTGTLALTSNLPNTFGTIAVSGQSDVVADSTTDTLTLVAGSNITLTTNAGSDSITIASSGGGGGGGGYTFITSATVGTAITSGITGYDKFVLEGSGLILSGGGDNFRLQFSVDGGSTWPSSWAINVHVRYTDSTSPTYLDTGSIGTAYMLLSGENGSATGTDNTSFSLILDALTSTSTYKSVLGKSSGYDNGGTHDGWFAEIGGVFKSASAVNAIRVYSNGGSTTGTYRLYGIPNS